MRDNCGRRGKYSAISTVILQDSQRQRDLFRVRGLAPDDVTRYHRAGEKEGREEGTPMSAHNPGAHTWEKPAPLQAGPRTLNAQARLLVHNTN